MVRFSTATGTIAQLLVICPGGRTWHSLGSTHGRVRTAIYRDTDAAAESGWDFSSRCAMDYPPRIQTSVKCEDCGHDIRTMADLNRIVALEVLSQSASAISRVIEQWLTSAKNCESAFRQAGPSLVGERCRRKSKSLDIRATESKSVTATCEFAVQPSLQWGLKLVASCR